MLMPKFDFEHYDSTETPWSLSLYFYFRSYLYYYSTCSLFFAIFPVDEFPGFFYFTLLYTPISLCLSCKQFALLFYLYFFSQCCCNLFSGTCFLWFSILVIAISFYHISFLSSTVYLSLLPWLYSLMIPKLYSYTCTSVLHMTTCSFCILLLSMLK